MNLTKILTVILFVVSLGLAYFLYNGVQQVIDDRAVVESTEAQVIERLRLIRESEVLYQEQHGKYTASWDTLARFIKTGRVPILQRREEIKQKAYGGEEVIVHVDTLGFVSVIDNICTKNYSLNAPDDGVFLGYKVKDGVNVIKNMKAYSLRVGERINEPPFQEKGMIDSLFAKEGDVIKKGRLLITYHDDIFNKKTDWDKLKTVPGSGVDFDIFVKKIDRNGVLVDVIEVKDPKPINPARRESNEQKARKPLRFGSRADVSTAGNWE